MGLFDLIFSSSVSNNRMKVARMMSAMTIIAVGSHLQKMDFSHYYIIWL